MKRTGAALLFHQHLLADTPDMSGSHLPNQSKRTSDVDHSNRRCHARRPQDNLKTNFGPVLDLSAGGMRFVSHKQLSGLIDIAISGTGIDKSLRARVIRCKKIGFRCFETAVRFVEGQKIAHEVEWLARWCHKKAG